MLRKFEGYYGTPAKQFTTGRCSRSGMRKARQTNTLVASKLRTAHCSLLRQLVSQSHDRIVMANVN